MDFIKMYAEFLDDGYPEYIAARLANESEYDDYNGCDIDIWN